MVLAPRGHEYPLQDVQVVPFPSDLSTLFPQPVGLIQDWPPTQITYLGVYLAHLGCKTVVVESHYVDRDYIHDMALFYSLSLRSYPNHCQRLHFFRESFDQARFRDLVLQREDDRRAEAMAFLQGSYLGFSVVRPLPGTPVGRTVLPPFGPRTVDGHEREFSATRDYHLHLAGFDLRVTGLAFQQQDQGASACATTALWSAFHRTAHLEGLPIPPPASITEAGSRYFLGGGRALPSEGLNIYQICEAIRAAGLAPLVIPGISPESDRAQILGYLGSGFAPVLAILPLTSDSGHAVCGVGIKLGPVLPQTNTAYHYRDRASSVLGIYVNDDRLGPYASADLYPYTTDKGAVRTGLRIRWPDQVEAEHSILNALIIPVPTKLRLTVARMRVLGHLLAEVTGQLFPAWSGLVTMNCRYCLGTAYRQTATGLGLSDEGLYDLSCKAVLSRYVGVIEISVPDGPLFDVLLDATETSVNPGALICVRRKLLAGDAGAKVESVARKLGARFIS